MKRIFCIDLFLIPSDIMFHSDMACMESREAHLKKWFPDAELTPESEMVYVWVASPDLEIDNLTCHGAGELAEACGLPGTTNFPSHLPLSMLEKMTEDDYDIFPAANGVRILIHTIQAKYRYRDFGGFDTLLKTMLNAAHIREAEKMAEEKV